MFFRNKLVIMLEFLCLRVKVVQQVVRCCLGVMLREDPTSRLGKAGRGVRRAKAVISRPLATCGSHR